jgi:subtilase family serine protease
MEYSRPDGKVAGASQVSFDLVLSLRNASGAENFAREVSTPGSALFHHYLTDAQWESRFGPTQAEVSKAESWLRHEGFTVGSVPKTRLFVSAEATARSLAHVFGVQFGYYKVNGEKVRLAKGTAVIPSSLTGAVSGVSGLSEYLATNDLAVQEHAAAKQASVKPSQEPGPPAGFKNPKPCAAYWGQQSDTADSPKLYAPFTSPAAYDICGYKPAQLRGAYGLGSSMTAGHDGSGVTVAIVDAYDSPTLLSDAQEYFKLNDPSHPLNASQFDNVEPSKIDDVAECGGNGWYPEQALDVESVHTMAPGANVEFVGAKDCTDQGLLDAVQTAVTSGASVVSDSWGDTLGDLLSDVATRTAYDNTFMLADSTGVSILYSSGDDGDNFADFGITAPDYPASSPYITAVGGTTLEVNSANNRAAEYGWSTAKQLLCTTTTATNCGSATTPEGALTWQAGGGGGTSYTYGEPYYQDGVVPSALSLRNENVTGEPTRVLPDISMDADAQSGLLIGLTQTFPNGTYYSQFKEGGTSLASPLLAGVVADTDSAAGTSLGFLNPELYKAYTATPAAFNDILPPANPDSAAVIRVDYVNETDASNGYFVSLRSINYAGPETFCDPTGNCATRDVTLTTAPGFDSLTGLGSVGSKFITTLSKY